MGKKGRVTQADIARICKLDQGSISRILNKETQGDFSPETIDRVLQRAHELGYLHPALVSSERRKSPRKKAQVVAHLKIITENNAVYDEGTAEVDTVSLSGMLFKNIKTKTNSIPLSHFHIAVEITSQKLKGFQCRGKVVRLADADEGLAVAIRYEHLSAEHRDQLKKYLKSV